MLLHILCVPICAFHYIWTYVYMASPINMDTTLGSLLYVSTFALNGLNLMGVVAQLNVYA
jgi:hypothetical protein